MIRTNNAGNRPTPQLTHPANIADHTYAIKEQKQKNQRVKKTARLSCGTVLHLSRNRITQTVILDDGKRPLLYLFSRLRVIKCKGHLNELQTLFSLRFRISTKQS